MTTNLQSGSCPHCGRKIDPLGHCECEYEDQCFGTTDVCMFSGCPECATPKNIIPCLVAALEKIADSSIVCLGPGCPYCESEEHSESEEHPQTWEAKEAKKALEKSGYGVRN